MPVVFAGYTALLTVFAVFFKSLGLAGKIELGTR